MQKIPNFLSGSHLTTFLARKLQEIFFIGHSACDFRGFEEGKQAIGRGTLIRNHKLMVEVSPIRHTSDQLLGIPFWSKLQK